MKKATIFLIIVVSIITLSTTVCFAEESMMNDAMEGIQNTMEDAGNVVKDTASGMANGVKNGVNSMANTMSNMDSSVMNSNTNYNNGNYNNNGYTAQRTATTGYTNDATFLGLNSTAWTWLIMGIIGAIVVGLVIYYNTQKDYDRTRSRNRDNF